MSSAITVAGISAAGAAYSANQQKKAAQKAASGSMGGAADNYAQQSWEDIERTNELNKQNALWSQQQNQASVNNALTQNRVDQTSDFGSIDWQQDPTTGAWSQKSSLAPELQGSLSALRDKYGEMIGGMESGFNVNNDVMQAYRALQQPGLETARNKENARLAAMGLGTGSGQAWGLAQDTLNRSENDAEQKAILAGFDAWKDTQGNLRNNLGTMGNLESTWKSNSQMPSFAQAAAPQIGQITVGAPKNMTWEAAQADREAQQMGAYGQAASGAGWGNVAGQIGQGVKGVADYGSQNGWWGGSGGANDWTSNSYSGGVSSGGGSGFNW